MTVIYHGTPLTPRAALLAVLPGRAGCVSFYTPDDVEAVEAVCPLIMFRQRRVFVLASGGQARRGMVRQAPRLAPILRMAGAATVNPWPLGRDTGCAWRAKPTQRRSSQRLAVRAHARRSPLAHGWPARTPGEALRAVRPCSAGLDRRSQERACGLFPLPAQDGRGIGAARQPMARNSHDARDRRGVRLPVRHGRCHVSSSERMAL